jgi:type I restriction enzyme S subunit
MSGTWILLLLTFCYSDKDIISCYQCFIKIILRKSTDNTCAWEQRKLSDLAEIVGGGTPDTNNSAYWDGDIDWYAPAEMEGQRYATGSVRKITELGLQKSSAKILPAHRTVLFTSRAGIGKMAILQRPAATNQGFQSLVLKDGTDPYFIYSMGERIKGMAEGVASGSTFLEISGKMLGNLEVMVPNLKEQESIATFFRGIDDLITLHQREESCAASFSASCFGTLKAFFWEQRKLGDLVQFSKGTGYSKGDLRESGTPIILYGRLYTKYETVISEVDTFADAKAGSVYSRGGEVIVPASGETAEDISIASVVEKSGVLLGGDLNIITPPANLDAPFLAISISNGKPHEDMAKMAQGKSVVHLHNTDLEKIDLTYPSHEEQIQISGYFGALDHLITLHQCKPKSRKGGSHVLYSYQV